ncbi:MAG TPA: hypothetical protein VGP05_13695 [Pseudonocardia sp.]|nr:hypothetical protein [Pseudonocardia sp.]
MHGEKRGPGATAGGSDRVPAVGTRGHRGADIGILVSRGRLQTEGRDGDAELTPLCRRWVEGLRSQVRATPLDGLGVPSTAYGVK